MFVYFNFLSEAIIDLSLCKNLNTYFGKKYIWAGTVG